MLPRILPWQLDGLYPKMFRFLLFPPCLFAKECSRRKSPTIPICDRIEPQYVFRNDTFCISLLHTLFKSIKGLIIYYIPISLMVACTLSLHQRLYSIPTSQFMGESIIPNQSIREVNNITTHFYNQLNKSTASGLYAIFNGKIMLDGLSSSKQSNVGL